MNATVALSRVTKRYRLVEAVTDVSFDLPPGETVALVGHNGAGKTTLLKLMLGLIRPTSGEIQILGQDPAEGKIAARLAVGYLPENVAFNPALTGVETLSFYARLKDTALAAALPLLDRVGLAAAAGRRIGTYSKGMRQRLGLAQALIGAPRVLLLDEPTTGLDPALRQTFYEIVRELRDAGATVVLSSHALSEIEDCADRVLIMNRGRLVANGTIDELRRLARLPTRIRIFFRGGVPTALPGFLAACGDLRCVNGHAVEFNAAAGTKMEVLRAAGEAGQDIEDIDVMSPSLDQLYAHFLRSGEAAQ